MKTCKMIALSTALLLSIASLSYAGYVTGFKVIGVTGDQVTIQKDKAEPIKVQTNTKFVVGEEVSFDAKKQRVIKALVGC